MMTDLGEQEMTQQEALRVADDAARGSDRASRALVRLAEDLRRAQARVAALEACACFVPLVGGIYEP